MFWMIFLYAVDTHQPLPSPDFRYPSEEVCKMEAQAVTQDGVSYAICKPVR
jgi:hypothetical protein